MTRLTIQEARTLAIHSQLLNQPLPAKGKAALLDVIEHLGYIQIDTISVVARAHQHVLWTRLPDYQESDLKTLEEKDRAVFEYWAHAASYLPMRDYRFSLVRKSEFLNGETVWFEKNHKLIHYVFDRIKAEGPLQSKDFENPDKGKKSETNGMDWSRNPVNLALRLLFMEGKIMVSHRRGFQKTYDLPERILPSHVDTTPPDRETYARYLIGRDARAHGLIKARETAYLLKNMRTPVNRVLREMVEEGLLVEAQVEGRDGETYFVHAPLLEQFPTGSSRREMTILSPFDNLVIQRKRLSELFDFDYTLECYVTAPKRKFGYFSLPVLWGDRFAGQLDLKADRRSQTLIIKNLQWEKGLGTKAADKKALSRSLRNFATFNGCNRVTSEMPGIDREILGEW